MTGESLRRLTDWPSLAARAKMTMAEHDEGQRRVPWDALTAMTPADVQLFQDTLIAEAARLGLELKVYAVEGQMFSGLEIRWRPKHG